MCVLNRFRFRLQFAQTGMPERTDFHGAGISVARSLKTARDRLLDRIRYWCSEKTNRNVGPTVVVAQTFLFVLAGNSFRIRF
ncbi:MAG: hypothetical protein DWH91_10580 [Planctomycetota bacterium]|nr:MAG: hypothetical protein DWH91_10580 [Planctomycetota bacterium]